MANCDRELFTCFFFRCCCGCVGSARFGNEPDVGRGIARVERCCLQNQMRAINARVYKAKKRKLQFRKTKLGRSFCSYRFTGDQREWSVSGRFSVWDHLREDRYRSMLVVVQLVLDQRVDVEVRVRLGVLDRRRVRRCLRVQDLLAAIEPRLG